MNDFQTIVVSIVPDLARRARLHVDSSTAYSSLSEFVAAAVDNQLALERVQQPAASSPGPEKPSDPTPEPTPLLRRPTATPDTAEVSSSSDEPLYSLTNRLFPLKIATRVLANMDEAELENFRKEAAAAARGVGLRLRREDERDGRKRFDRRWIALPVGDKVTQALWRYQEHFAIGRTANGHVYGPLSQLSLASLDGENLRLTPLGASLAAEANSALDGFDGPLLSESECGLFAESIKSNPAELKAVRMFSRWSDAQSVAQHELDEALSARHPDWTASQVIASRAALLGRLGDLRVAAVAGTGSDAEVTIDQSKFNDLFGDEDE